MFFSKKKIKEYFSYSTIFLLIGRCLGILQDKALMFYFKTSSEETDVFFIASRIPVFVRQMFGEKLLSLSVTPEIVNKLQNNQKDEALELLTFFLILTATFSLIIILTCYNWPMLIMKFFAPGFSASQIVFVNKYFPKMLWYILFILCAEILSIGLRSTNNFFMPALGPVVFHLTMITIIFIAIYFNFSAEIIAYGISFGAFVKFIIRYLIFKNKNLYFLTPTPRIFNSVLSILKKMIPMLFVLSLMQANFLTEGIIGSFLPAGNITLLHYIYRLYNVLMIVFTVPITTIFLPNFAKLYSNSNKKLNFIFCEAAKVIIWIIIPISFLAIIFAPHLIAFIHNKPLCDPQIQISAIGFSILCLNLIIAALNSLLTTLFFAANESRIPTFFQSLGTAISILGCFVSLKTIGFLGIIITTLIGSIITTSFLFYFGTKKFINLPLNNIFQFLKTALLFPTNLILFCLASINMILLFNDKALFLNIKSFKIFLLFIIVFCVIFFIPKVKIFSIKRSLNLFFLK